MSIGIALPTSYDDEIQREIRRLLQECQDKFDELATKVSSILQAVPDFLTWAVSKVIDAWNDLLAKAQEMWEWFTDKLAYVGSPAALSSAAAVWENEVARPAASMAEQLELAFLEVDDQWEGAAADQYRQGISPQQKAAEDLEVDYAKNVSGALGSLSAAITTFWIAIAVAVIALIAEIALGIAALAGVVTAPAVIIVVAAGVVTLLLACTTAGTALYLGVDDANGKLDDVELRTTPWPQLGV